MLSNPLPLYYTSIRIYNFIHNREMTLILRYVAPCSHNLKQLAVITIQLIIECENTKPGKALHRNHLLLKITTREFYPWWSQTNSCFINAVFTKGDNSDILSCSYFLLVFSLHKSRIRLFSFFCNLSEMQCLLLFIRCLQNSDNKYVSISLSHTRLFIYLFYLFIYLSIYLFIYIYNVFIYLFRVSVRPLK
jgi:hypothetical protein